MIAYESGVPATVDPLAGSYFVEKLTNDLETKAEDLLAQIASMGGSVAAIEEGWMQGQIEDSAYREARRQGSGESVVIGVNRFTSDESEPIPVLDIDPALEESQKDSVRAWRAGRDQDGVASALSQVGAVAATEENLMVAIKDALGVGATVGEISDSLRDVFGVYRPTG